MKLFEQMTPPPSSFEMEDGPTASDAVRALDVLKDLMRHRNESGIEVPLHEKLAFVKAMRDVCLEDLAKLEQVYAQKKATRPEDFQLLKFQLANGFLQGQGERDVRIFIDMDAERNAAKEILETLKMDDELIGAYEEEMGMSPEDLANHAEVRRRHREVIMGMWEMN